ncbi:hypothetical protein [Arthrobacter sp. FW306-2-2C-D06B]|uniref:hypothetical protein n=1 Tax=Arthrobacter sp. FW306-2-2C-D06B TaxID=2879618 RepID=UPI001F364836|nr:hypothetical protein [Arthrobacter sp. FW306-2-2C-D06B]UKA59788.1 hypothetical protein LFT47_05440 [Arthrobacter sp. FW306-2-2C-D06B]
MGAATSSTTGPSAHGDIHIDSPLVSNAATKYTDGEAGAAKVSNPNGVPISVIIHKVKDTDPGGFAARLNTLKSSPEFSSFLISRAGSVEAGGGEGLAAVLTQQQINAFVASIKGKTFEVITGKDGKPAVALSTKKQPAQTGAATLASTANSRATITTAGWSGPSCWQGWFAMGGYSAATGAICGAVGAFSLGIGWVTCAGFGAFGAGINWNDACR